MKKKRWLGALALACGALAQAGCGGTTPPKPKDTPPAKVAAEKTSEPKAASAPEPPNAEQQALAAYGGLPHVQRMPEAMRPSAALAIHRVKSIPALSTIDPEHLVFLGARRRGGRTELRVRQRVGDVPVFGAAAWVAADEGNPKGLLGGRLYPDARVETTRPTISSTDAVKKALGSVRCPRCDPNAARVWLFVLHREGRSRLAYRVWPRLGASSEPYPMVFVDAHRGDVVWTCKRGEDPACFDEDR